MNDVLFSMEEMKSIMMNFPHPFVEVTYQDRHHQLPTVSFVNPAFNGMFHLAERDAKYKPASFLVELNLIEETLLDHALDRVTGTDGPMIQESYCKPLAKWFHVTIFLISENKVGFIFRGASPDIIDKEKLDTFSGSDPRLVEQLKAYYTYDPLIYGVLDKTAELETYFENTLDLLTIVSLEGEILKINGEWEHKSGFTKDELTGQKIIDFIHTEDYEATKEQFQTLYDNQRIDEFVNRLVTKNNETVYLEWRATLLDDSIIAVARDISYRKSLEKELHERNQQYLDLVEQVPGAIYQYQLNPDGHHFFPIASSGIWDIYEVTPEEAQKSADNVLSRVAKSDYEKVAASITHSANTLTVWEDTHRVNLPSRGQRWLRGYAKPEKHEDGKIIWHGYIRDVTELKENERTLQSEREYFKTTLLSISDGVITTDLNGNIIFINHIAELLTGYSKLFIKGKVFSEVIALVEDETETPLTNPVKEVISKEQVYSTGDHSVMVLPDGRKIGIEMTASPLFDVDDYLSGVVVVFRDVTAQRQENKKIRKMTFHDTLTGLYNRLFFEEELKRLDTPRNYPLAFLYMDVNGLKLINDVFGHDSGDELLKRVASVLNAACRHDDIISRVGGDEFIIILPNTQEQDLITIRSRLTESLQNEHIEHMKLSVALGSSLKASPQEVVDHLLEEAEADMYMDKMTKKNQREKEAFESLASYFFETFPDEKRHGEEVERYSEAIARQLNLPAWQINRIQKAARYHDIGKLSLPKELVKRTKEFDDQQWQEFMRHPESGYHILSNISHYKDVADAVLAHHERYDGNGYPRQLKGDEIPIEAQIISLAELYDIMTKEMTDGEKRAIDQVEKALNITRDKQFRADIVDAFMDIIDWNTGEIIASQIKNH
ncbi:sensor domain-containing diguanylate cyclase/phosphohydrolase [Salisediminibacterium beveridgei]|uniref:Diguanylate cyclase/phosphodiesterase (GGDEF & EAL domains) with PAS/PAC sensor(S) n=1 Tax=Salisediminibacterium beveridgei TaxID=632773 RepID=A0A1D7QZF1_9BACI|nr:diguanylate cyclase [Salisediminibacterium beveridgei]AOM84394.1 diguanylate cyclase/phosphodiesterase (GGDEF & EAL domains) with PAS/PAC sensor(s) [Salisediminibacterium beveridgei]